MSGDTIELKVEKRDLIGKGLQKIREAGQIPAVIHNHGKESIHIKGDAKELAKVYNHAGKHAPVEITLGKEKHLTLIKDVDVEPIKNNIRHVVFQAVRRGEKIDAEIPVVFKEGAVIPAEQNSLLVLKSLDHVEVLAIPSKLPDQLVVDPSTLVNEGDSLTVADIVVPEGVEITTDSSQGIATVEVPRDQLAEADAAAESLAEDAERTESGEDAVPTDQPAEEDSESSEGEGSDDASKEEKSE